MRTCLLSRREFLARAATVAVGGAAARAAGFASAGAAVRFPGKKIMVGGHLWVYAADQPRYDPTAVLETVFSDFKYAGLDCVELMHLALLHDDAVDRIGGLIAKYHLPVIGTSIEAPMWNRAEHAAILKDAEVFIPRLQKLGARTMGTSVGRADRVKTPAELDAQSEMVRKLTEMCKTHGITLNLHNHTYEVENNEYDLKGTLARVPDAKLGPDLNWLVRGGEDPIDFIKRYANRIVFLHLRDQGADGKWTEAMGEGVMNYPTIGKALEEIHFSGDAMIELAHERGFKLTRPLRENWKISREYVRKTLGF
ncbi:MAG: sugar phosphate isomerase/epimerase family protein [Terriglobia bacterium]